MDGNSYAPIDLAPTAFSYEGVDSCIWLGDMVHEEYPSSDKVAGYASWIGYYPLGDGLSTIRISEPIQPPFDTVEEMKNRLGEEDIYSGSTDFTERRYTYLGSNITFSFNGPDQLGAIQLGDVKWRSQGILTRDYRIQGRVICPGDECPWSGEGLKPEYENASYRDFLPD